MSHGSEVAAPAGAAPPAIRVPQTSAAAPPRTSNALLACRSRDRTVIIEPAFLIRRSFAVWSPLRATRRATGRRRARMLGCGACHLLTRAGQVVAVQPARQAWPRRAVMLALTIPAR